MSHLGGPSGTETQRGHQSTGPQVPGSDLLAVRSRRCSSVPRVQDSRAGSAPSLHQVGAVAAPRLHKHHHGPGCSHQRQTRPCFPLRGRLPLPWTAAGHEGSVSGPLQTWRGRGGSERGHRAPERRRAGASSPARLTTRDRTPLGTQGCCPPWASAQPRGRLPSTAQQVLPCAATGKPGSRSPAEARPAPRNARGTLLQGVTTRGGEWGARDPCSRSRAHQQELSDAGNGGPRAE